MNASAATQKRVAAFVDSDYTRVVAAVALATGDRQRAEDAVQDALVATLAGDTEPTNLSGWITVVAINYVRQGWRRDGAQDRAYVRAVEFDDESDIEAERATDAITIHEAMAQLPTRQREIVALFYFQRLGVNEIAKCLGVSGGTVKTQLHRGRSRLAELLGREVR